VNIANLPLAGDWRLGMIPTIFWLVDVGGMVTIPTWEWYPHRDVGDAAEARASFAAAPAIGQGCTGRSVCPPTVVISTHGKHTVVWNHPFVFNLHGIVRIHINPVIQQDVPLLGPLSEQALTAVAQCSVGPCGHGKCHDGRGGEPVPEMTSFPNLDGSRSCVARSLAQTGATIRRLLRQPLGFQHHPKRDL